MLPLLAGKLIRENPEALLDRTAGWTEWERERAARTVLKDWAGRAPQEAWTWYQSQRDQLGPELASSVLETWARSAPEAAKGLLNSLSDPVQRRAAVESIGRALALKNSAEAVAWADGLQNPEEKEAAHRSIYEATPRGIGAVIGLQNGFPTLQSVLPGSPLAGTGIRPGDQIVEVWQADGTHQSLYGAPLESSVRLIRGEPGSELELRILRRDENTGQLNELRVPVRRAQLYFDEPSSPKKN
jgi:C-terminal processing protease CtpA/Prc